jgi:hypothetical protein
MNRVHSRLQAGALSLALVVATPGVLRADGQAASGANPGTLLAAASSRAAHGPALQQTSAPEKSTKSFFKTPAGVAALGLFVGVIAWTAASRSKDAVHSPGRK